MQPWNMRKKLRLVVQAKSYIKKHEGQLQERLAQSHSTKDMLARWNIVLIKVSDWDGGWSLAPKPSIPEMAEMEKGTNQHVYVVHPLGIENQGN